ncbi:redoxin domain-containing protein [Pedobacter frigoris]|uniref:redoxin domain-containing protein n=1 Tax=Pedobacter frigoris TaxID=2571272 RepID=UPI00293143A6|nr:redoxin domain-containing protein [Pedobacter frigoris]
MKLGKMALIVIFLTAAMPVAFGQRPNKSEIITDKAELAKLQTAVEASPDSLKVHTAFIKAMGTDNPELEKQYEVWMTKYPKSAMVPYALGKAYEDQESPKAKPYLLKTVALDPKFTEAWGGLWIDAERWGDFAGGRDYLAKAVASDPSNPNYNFYYASSFSGADEAKYRELSLAVAKKFPSHERGAQALYWLGARSKKVADKMKYFELLRKSYSPLKFNWSASGMSSYYDILLSENPAKAITLAKEMAKDAEKQKEWSNLALQAQNVAAAKKLIAAKKPGEAKAALNKIKLPRYFSFNKEIVLLKAKADDIAGNTGAAYDSLIVAFGKAPSLRVKSVIKSYGAKLGKQEERVEADIWNRLDGVAKAATPFTLKQYFKPESASLSDYKGKVVLLTYWFPGCGPCRGEFPHFENVVRKFKGKDLEYIGINIVSDQNDYVVPFMKSSGYSFTPLEEVKGRTKGNLDNGGAAPTNFLIDQQGRVVFSNFRTDGDNEDDLELMINLLLASKTL